MGVLSLIAKLAMDATGFHAGLNSAERGAKALGDRLEHHFKSKMGQLIGVAAVEEAVRRTIEYADRIEDFATRYGISTKAAQEFDFALKREGGTLEMMAGILDKLAASRAKALGGDSDTMRQWEKFGITLSTLQSSRLEDLAKAISRVFHASADPQALLDPFRELAGKSAGALIPTMISGLDEAAAEAQRLNVILGEDVIKSLKELKATVIDLMAVALKPLADTLAWISRRATQTMQFLNLTFAGIAGQLYGGRKLRGEMGREVLDEIIRRKNAAAEPSKPRVTEFDDEGKAAARSAEEQLRLERQLTEVRSKDRFDRVVHEKNINELFKERRELQKAISLTRGNPLLNTESQIELEKVNKHIYDLLHGGSTKAISTGTSGVGGFYIGADVALRDIQKGQLTKLGAIDTKLGQIMEAMRGLKSGMPGFF